MTRSHFRITVTVATSPICAETNGQTVSELGADQRAACREIAEQLAALETRRPALAFKSSRAARRAGE